MLGAFTENGPYNFKYNETASKKEKAHFEYNKFSWNNNAHVLFIDQPIGTGFSVLSEVKDFTTNTQSLRTKNFS
jgi:carboxypeptidase D